MEQQNTNDLTLKEQAITFLKQVATGNVREAFKTYISPDFKHHNAFFPGDADSLMLAMEENANDNPDKTFEVKLAIQEKDTVAVHSHVKQNSDDLGVAVVHIFRFVDNKIVEMWDLGQPVPKDSPNKNGMF